jgi:hypothetical protein
VIEQSLDIMRWALAQHDQYSWLVRWRNASDAMHALIAEATTESSSNTWTATEYPNRYRHEHSGDEQLLPRRTD